MAYIGQTLTEGTRRVYTYTATASQSTFNAVYNVGQVEVHQNGILLQPSDYTASSGTTIVLGTAAALDDEITITCHNTFSVADTVSSSQGGTFLGAVSASNGLTVDDSAATPLTVDRSGAVGSIIDVQKDGSTVGQISNIGNDFVVGSSTGSGAGLRFDGTNNMMYASNSLGNARDNAVSLGASSVRFKDLYLSSGIYLGGTGASNHLDDYEEGTYTVNVTKGGSALPVNVRYGYYVKVGDMFWVSFYWYHNGGLSSQTNNSTEYRMSLPFNVLSLHNGAYQSVPCGYLALNSSNVFNNYPHRWQANATSYLSLYGVNYATAHTSGGIEFSGSGCFRIA